MKSCFSALQGAGLGRAQLQLCQTSDVHRGRRGEKMDCTRGWWEVEEGQELFKDQLHFRDSVILQYSRIDMRGRGSGRSQQTPVCFLFEIVLPFQLRWKSDKCDLCSHRQLLWCQQSIGSTTHISPTATAGAELEQVVIIFKCELLKSTLPTLPATSPCLIKINSCLWETTLIS